MKRFLLSSAVLTGILPFSAMASCPWFEESPPTYREHEECKEFAYDEEEVVTVGNLIERRGARYLSSPIATLTDIEIENRNQVYIGDLLRSVPGVAVNRSGPGGGLTQIRLRGAEANHTLVIIDGVEVSNPTAGEFDFSGLRADDVTKIEVLRGEQSALYGSDAIGGVINITTKAGRYAKLWEATVEGGSFGTFSGQASAVVPIGRTSLSLGVGALNTEGYDISGQGGEKDGSESQNFYVGLNRLFLGDIRLSGKYANSKLDTEFDEDPPFSGRISNTNSQTEIDTETARIDARFDIAGFENLIVLSGHDIQTDTQGESIGFMLGSRVPYQTFSEGKRRKASWTLGREMDAHKLSVLAEAEKETYEISPSFAANPVRPENTNYGLVGDYRYETEEFSLGGSVRQDFNDRFDNALTWKVGGTYSFDWDGRVRANLGTGIKNPSMIELFGFFPDSNFVGNPDLMPEESFGYGIGYEQQLESFKISIDYFKSELTDEIFTDFSSFPFLARNRTTDSEREGVELSLGYNDYGSFNVDGALTWLDTTENGIEELRRPEWSGSLTATWSPLEDLSLTASADYTGSQMDTDFSTFQTVKLDAYTLVGLNIAYDISDELTLTLRGENLLDEDYEEVVGYRSQGLGVFGGLRARFGYARRN